MTENTAVCVETTFTDVNEHLTIGITYENYFLRDGCLTIDPAILERHEDGKVTLFLSSSGLRAIRDAILAGMPT